MQAEKITALYARYSAEDEIGGESNSIVHQRKMLESYAAEKGFKNCRFYVDDGYSDVAFDNRPAFKEMLSEIENGNVAVVITKDLSRFGRNFLLVGQYLQIIFPEYGVRYIAVNDNIDTIQGEDEFTELRSLFNEWYYSFLKTQNKTNAHKPIFPLQSFRRTFGTAGALFL